ncbi:MAG TPA: cation transporter [Syntrophobacteraceae bacterium]|nr:cation transporter [Syntrophobacteraceae bacterium]
MHIYTLERWQHEHDFALIHEKGERRTLQVLWLTAVTMVAEVIAGSVYGSMALLADGWHMGTHVAAFAISVVAYRVARRYSSSSTFSFGTGKVNILGGFASAVVLTVVAVMMLLESAKRLLNPQTIYFNEAIAVAVLGLFINLISIGIMHGNDHAEAHDHDHGCKHHDLNLKAAYLHVLADMFTSILAIVALLAGKYLGLGFLDAFMGMVGAMVIGHWSYHLLRETSSILLDCCTDSEMARAIQERIEGDSDNRVVDMHLWRVGGKHYAVIISLVTHYPKETARYKALLRDMDELSHVTVEINQCTDKPCIPLRA